MNQTRSQSDNPRSTRIFSSLALAILLISVPSPGFAQAPPNDFCDDAVSLSCSAGPSIVLGNNESSTASSAPSCGTNPGSTAVWYSVMGNGFDIQIDTCSPNTVFDTKINIYTGDCGDQANMVCIGGNDDAAGSPPECDLGGFTRLSRFSWSSVDGVEYLILVSGFGGLSGDFELTLDCEVPVELQRLTVQ